MVFNLKKKAKANDKPFYHPGFGDRVVCWARQVTAGVRSTELLHAGRQICPTGYQNPRNNRSCYNEVSLHMLALNLDSRPCQVFLQLLASELSFQKDKNYLSKCKALTMKYTAYAVGKPTVYFHRLQLVCVAEMIHSSSQQNKSAYRVLLNRTYPPPLYMLRARRTEEQTAGGWERMLPPVLHPARRQYTVTVLGSLNGF